MNPADDNANLIKRLVKVEEQVRRLLKPPHKPQAAKKTKLGDHVDVSDDASNGSAVSGQVLGFDGTEWDLVGGPPVAIDGTGDFAVSGTGNLTISERLVPTGWDDSQWVRVWATVVAGGSGLTDPVQFSPDEVSVGFPAGTVWSTSVVEIDSVAAEIEFIDQAAFDLYPASSLGLYEPFPELTLILTDESGPTANYAADYTRTAGPDGRTTLSLSWLYSGGIPLVQASLAPGAAYPGSHTLTVLARYEPVPYRPAP